MRAFKQTKLHKNNCFLFVLPVLILFLLSGCSNSKTDSAASAEPTEASTADTSTVPQTYEGLEDLGDVIENPEYQELIGQADAYLNKIGYQGTVLFAKGDDIFFAKGYGYANREKKIPNKVTTRFEIGSMSKQFTAAAIMLEVEKGTISVDDYVSDYLPDFQYGDRITVKNLLQMRSGLYDYLDNTTTFFKHKKDQKLVNDCADVSRDFVTEHWNECGLRDEPGGSYEYINFNYYLLAKILEKVTGEYHEDYITENIFKPCGMTHSSFSSDDIDSTGYDGKKVGPYISFGLAFGCGGINQNIFDFFRWERNFINGRVVKPETFTEMTTMNGSYGYGVMGDQNVIMHGGACFAYNSYGVYYTRDDVTMIGFMNNEITDMDSAPIITNIRKMYTSLYESN